MGFMAFCALACVTMTVVMLHVGPKEDDTAKTRAYAMTIFACAAVLWPVVWFVSIGRIILRDGSWLVLFGALWPQIMMLMDLAAVSTSGFERLQSNLTPQSVQEDANSLIGIAFAFAMMMLATYASAKKEMYASVMLVLFALAICIAFIVPQPINKKDTMSAYLATISQRSIFSYSMGFLLSALCVIITVGASKIPAILDAKA